MTRKGVVTEIFSKALHYDNPDLYFVGYLDFKVIKESTLTEFLRISDNFETIPATRIIYIKKDGKILYYNQIMKNIPSL